jgi:hypothetical protein
MEIVESLEKTIKLAEDISDIEFEELKAEVTELTNDNFHTEALLTIANYYNMDKYIPYFTELKEFQESPEYFGSGLTVEQAQERLEMSHKMFDELKDKIGMEKAKELYSCL